MKLSFFSTLFFAVVVFMIAFPIGYFQRQPQTFFESVYKTSFEPNYDRVGFVGQAISLLHTGTLNFKGENGGYTDQSQRGPVYSFFLALGFWIFGEYLGVIYVFNFVFLVIAAHATWRIAQRFLPGWWALIPGFCVSAFWGGVYLVWVPSYELCVLAIAHVSFLFLLKYFETHRFQYLAFAGLGIGLWTLEKPQVMYFIPIVVGFLLYKGYYGIDRSYWKHAFILGILSASVVGVWMARNYVVLGTVQLGGGGHSILRRATQAEFTRQERTSMYLSFMLGDYVAKRVYADFPQNAPPRYWDDRVEERWYQRSWLIHEPDGSIITRIELDKRFYKEAFAIIEKHPIRFAIDGAMHFFRLNAPQNWNGTEIMRMFAAQDTGSRFFIKTTIILTMRIFWLIFLFFVGWGMFHSRRILFLQLLILFILYYNGLQMLFTHSEPRYILTALPFYFLFATIALRYLVVERYKLINF